MTETDTVQSKDTVDQSRPKIDLDKHQLYLARRALRKICEYFVEIMKCLEIRDEALIASLGSMWRDDSS